MSTITARRDQSTRRSSGDACASKSLGGSAAASCHSRGMRRGRPVARDPVAAWGGVTPAVNAGGCAGRTIGASGAGREDSRCGGRGDATAAEPGATLPVSAGRGEEQDWQPRRSAPTLSQGRSPRFPSRQADRHRRAACRQLWDRPAPDRSSRGPLLRCLPDRPIQPSLGSILYLDGVDVHITTVAVRQPSRLARVPTGR